MTQSHSKSQYIKDLADKSEVRSPFLVKFSAVSVGKTGKPFMNVVLMDKTGEVDAKIWDDVPKFAGQVVQDSFVWVKGKCQLYQGRKQVVIKEAQILREDDVDAKEFVPEGTVDPDVLYDSLLKFVDSMEDPFYKALAESILKEDDDVRDRLRRAPGGKSIHHAYPAGLLEHIVSITGLLDQIAGHYDGKLDRDLLFLGGFLHDIGKLWELSYDRVTDYTDEGRLIGHLVMGVELVERKIQALNAESGRLPGAFPEDKKLLVKHVILSHHGKLEYGSPKRPKILEALVVHYIDDLDSKMSAIESFMQSDQNPGKWTGLSRQYERFFLKPDWLLEKQSN